MNALIKTEMRAIVARGEIMNQCEKLQIAYSKSPTLFSWPLAFHTFKRGFFMSSRFQKWNVCPPCALVLPISGIVAPRTAHMVEMVLLHTQVYYFKETVLIRIITLDRRLDSVK